MEIFAAQCRYLYGTAEPMLDGLNDSHLALEPIAGNKSAGWILGHLTITGDFARRLCGRPPICPKEWRALFSPGTTSGGMAAEAYPRMADMLRVFLDVYRDLPDALLNADGALLGTPNPFEPARPAFPTAREFVPYIMTGHFGYHLGQLGDWRRAAGLGHKSNI
jgi:hypothetical protein